MPVLDIRALPQKPGVDAQAALKRVCTELAQMLGERPTGTWGTWVELLPGSYTEGDDAPAVQPDATHPPLVRLFAFEGKSRETVERMITLVADTLADALRVEPGNVFVTYDEGRSGRVYSGGSLIKKEG
jgi:phenylpyruvate tautomerase PptA (4-oxalocrotonate tautomerase family)